MATLPRDASDLRLAPVALALDAQIGNLAQLDLDALIERVALESDRSDTSREDRQAGLLDAVQHFIDCHGWTPTWDTRGVRITHGEHSIVLGVPATFGEYVSGAYRATRRSASI